MISKIIELSITALLLVFGIGVAWANINGRLNTVENHVGDAQCVERNINEINERLARMETNMEWLVKEIAKE